MSTRTIRSSITKQQFWQKHITGWRSSGLSQRQYCEQHGLAVQTFGYWHSKLKQENEDKPRFFPISVTTVATPAPIEQAIACFEVKVCDSRFGVKINRNFDEETLHKLILSLEAIPCSAQAKM